MKIESKKKWNALASKNAPYYVMTDYGENITEEQFRYSGKKNYEEFVINDEILNSYLSPFNQKDMLEIGCGIGRITEFFSEQFKSVSGVDISDEMIKKAKHRLKSKNNIYFYTTDGLHFPFPDASFDFVFSFIVFQHMPNKTTIKKNISELVRVLKKGGIAKIQLRGLPTSKKNWFYGPSFSVNDVNSLIKDQGLKLLKSDGVNQRYFWVWLTK